jgi:hypothetical protein
MAITDTLRNLLRTTSPHHDDNEIVFGLPLEVDDRKIYPVYLEPASVKSDGHAHPRQIGYVEVEDGWADFVSLERDINWPAVLVGVMIIVLTIVWQLRRSRN